MFAPHKFTWIVLITFLTLTVRSADFPRYNLHGHVPNIVNRLSPKGLIVGTNELQLAIGLPLHNRAALGDLMHQLYNPASTNYHKFLTPSEFTARFGPTVAEYQALQDFAHANGFTIIHEHGNRLVLDVTGRADNVQKAFHVALRTYHHPTENRDFFAPDTEPSVPANLSVADVWGLSDYWEVKSSYHDASQLKAHPLGGSGPLGYYSATDLRTAYVPGTPLDGTGQSVALLQFSSYNKTSITNYEHMVGYTNLVDVYNIVLPGGSPSSSQNEETCLDIEMAIAMSPHLAHVIVYEERSVSPSTILSQMANDNLAQQLSSSWTWSGGPSATVDSALLQMIMQGQSYFQAAGDSDAYTGSQLLDGATSVTEPVDSTNVISVGGTTLTTSGAGGPWSSETVWNYAPFGGSDANVGTGGGISQYYTRPAWQSGVNTNTSQASAIFRNIPDVAFLADGIDVVYSSNSKIVTNGVAGTSCAAPMWAGFCALMNQQAAVSGSSPVGFINPAIYNLALTTNYQNAFHDITTGNNIGNNTPGEYYATDNYDLCTGFGTPNGMGLVDALAPAPGILVQPVGQSVIGGTNVTLAAVVLGAQPRYFQWRVNGTNLPAGGNVSGVNSNVLVITTATANNNGNYSLVYTNPFGAVTSSVAVLTVSGQPPGFATQPTNLTLLTGSTAIFTANVTGTPLSYQWQRFNTNLLNGANTSGVNTNTLTLSNITTNNAGNYTLILSNATATVTSSVATLTVTLPPAIIASTLTNETIQCGANAAYSVTLSGTTPLSVQWKLDSVAIAGATNTSLSLTNIHLPNHTVSVTITNLYATVTSNTVLSVQDTLPPAITLNGASRMTNELGATFIDPGATALDQCAGIVPVTTNGSVNVNVIGTNTLTYTATDGNGNTNSALRTVVVRDTTAPAIVYSFTNLFLSLDTNCGALMPNVTGTNDFLATDLSGAPVITQSPATNTALALGTNLVILTATDTSGNASYSTNHIVVSDTTLPAFTLQPLGQTNFAGTNITFNAAATACSTIAYQWLFNSVALTNQTQPTLVLSNVIPGQSGNYAVVATTVAGSTTSAVAQLTVNLNATVLLLASSVNPDGYLTPLTFTASVNPTNATGAVAFFTNGAAFDAEPLVSGSATSTNMAALPRGTNLITAIYAGDAADSPATNTLSQIVTNHPPLVVSPLSYTIIAGFNLTVPIASLATNWSDADGDTLALAGLTPSTNSITVQLATNPPPSLVYADTNYVNDQFTCLVTDGFGGTNTEVINIIVQPQTNSTPAISHPVVTSTGLTLTLGGAYNSTYILETATDLSSGLWTPIATNQLGVTGTWQFTDTNFVFNSHNFYRLKLVQ